MEKKYIGNDFKKIIINTFIVLLLCTVFSYIFQAIYLIIFEKNVFWTMSRIDYTNWLFEYGPHLKDIVLIILFVMLIFYDYHEKSKKLLYIVFGAIVFGIVLLFINDKFYLEYIISGIREILYPITIICFGKIINLNSAERSKIENTIKFTIVTEFIIVLLSIIKTNSLFVFGSGGYRFMGTFGNGANLGYYAVACSLYFLINRSFIKNNSKNNSKTDYIYFILLIFLSIASGSRVSILSVLLVLVCYINIKVLNKKKISKNKLLIANVILLIVLSPIVYTLLINKINRGNFMLSGAYRIEIYKSMFLVRNFNDLFILLFGNGLGFGTNSAFILGAQGAYIVDGTFSAIILQYGLFGLAFIFKKIIDLLKKYDINLFVLVGIFGAFLLLSLAINIFEQYAFIIITIYSFSLLKKCKKR